MYDTERQLLCTHKDFVFQQHNGGVSKTSVNANKCLENVEQTRYRQNENEKQSAHTKKRINMFVFGSLSAYTLLFALIYIVSLTVFTLRWTLRSVGWPA